MHKYKVIFLVEKKKENFFETVNVISFSKEEASHQAFKEIIKKHRECKFYTIEVIQL